VGRSQWEKCEEFVSKDGKYEIYGEEWGMPGNDIDVMMREKHEYE